MAADLNVYDVEHVCTAHPGMSREAWENIYREAWQLYYSPEHMKTLLRRAAATGVPLGSLIKLLVSFATMVPLENVHPLQSGLLRLKRPSERRPGMKRVHPLIFWPQFIWETARKHVALAGAIVRLAATVYRISRDPASKVYLDQALMPVGADDEETLDLFIKTAGGTAAVAHVKRVAALTRGTPAV
ncbi:hypothetical protein ILFOPFJJ_00632 [Ensifer psoraleae]|nr:hypothetical protein [Sinorhizobium psoraleae]